MEAMVDAAVHIGFPRHTAIQLVTATLKGSATYAQHSKTNLATLKQNVHNFLLFVVFLVI